MISSGVNRDKKKLFYAVIYGDEELFEKTLVPLSEKWGEIDFISRMFPFDKTAYYEAEMGSALKRKFVSFKPLIEPEALIDAKLYSESIEKSFSVDGRRRINLDPGYIDYMKLILASFKYAPHKIYLTDGIYADLTLIYSKGRLSSFPWTFPDFRDETYHSSILRMRELFKKSYSGR